jgi:hypothetical protein
MRTLFIIPALVVLGQAMVQPAQAVDKAIKDRLLARWKHQAEAKEEFSYPLLMWHQVRGGGGQWGWVQPNWIYERRGKVTRKAVFIVAEKLSDNEAIVDVMITQYTPGVGAANRGRSGRPSKTVRTRKQFLFTGFDFREIAPKQQLNYVGGVLSLGERIVARANGTDIELTQLEPVAIPPLPKHSAELGIGVRTWADDTGQFSMDAAFDSLKDGIVTLVTPDGREVQVAIQRLAAADQQEALELATNNHPKRRSFAQPRRRKQPTFSQKLGTKLKRHIMSSLNRGF